MPLEISEIGVHVAVGGATPTDTPPPAGAASAPSGEAETPAQAANVVQALVRRVLQSLKAMQAR